MKRIILATVFMFDRQSLHVPKGRSHGSLLAVPYSTTPDGLYSPQFPSYLDAYELQEVVPKGILFL
jgi:hypothetical protein